MLWNTNYCNNSCNKNANQPWATAGNKSAKVQFSETVNVALSLGGKFTQRLRNSPYTVQSIFRSRVSSEESLNCSHRSWSSMSPASTDKTESSKLTRLVAQSRSSMQCRRCGSWPPELVVWSKILTDKVETVVTWQFLSISAPRELPSRATLGRKFS